ncbi:hypothetical protein [Psychroflexus sp. MES1-P1E]|uniref:hypothetical protein n=1 Tax=Psychroflexus sp. MES1-P1E TaxID=2058320 RepID=UPI000C7C5687|nr:hypothetical protein [Psychroflexus sp. MES1-P1E]PKG42748.1 hypothetical protein CXF67_08630 [Psychroflexus sp. MES1-P1E]
MKNKLIPILLLIFTFVANAQIYDGTLVEDSKGRFIGDIKVLGIMNRAPIDAVDKTGLLNEFTLKMKVWDYLGEPLEMYAFQWFRKESFRVKVDNTTRSIGLDQLKEYPDLQKRFLDLRPTKVDIKISGNARKISVEESSVPIDVNYTYIVKDVDLLIAKEGAFREPTVAGSPPTWNEFFDWQYPEPMGQLVNLNVSEASFKRLSEEEQKQRIKKIKNIWKQVKQLNVNASIETLEWPEYEMIDIIKTYDRYKNKKKELSLQEILDAELAKIQRTTEYNRNDEWGELPELVNPMPKVGIKTAGKRDGTNINVLIDLDTGNEITLKNDFLQEYDPKEYADVPDSDIAMIWKEAYAQHYRHWKEATKKTPNPIGILLDNYILFKIDINGAYTSEYYEITNFAGERVFKDTYNKNDRGFPLVDIANVLYLIDKDGDVSYYEFDERPNIDENFNVIFTQNTPYNYGGNIDMPWNIYYEYDFEGNRDEGGPFDFQRNRVHNLVNKNGINLILSGIGRGATFKTWRINFAFYDDKLNFKGNLVAIEREDYFEK